MTEIQYLGVYGNSATQQNDPSMVIKRIITDQTDNIQVCTPFYAWKDDYAYGLKFFWNLDDRGLALEEVQVVEIIDQWKKNWPNNSSPK